MPARTGARKTARANSRAALSQTSESERGAVEAAGLEAERRELREEVRSVGRRSRDRDTDRAGDRSGRCAAGRARAAVRRHAAVVALLGRTVTVRMHGVVMAIAGIVIVVRPGRAILVVTKCHALLRRDRGHALDRDGEGQQKERKNSEQSFRHRRAFYVNCLERGPPRGFPRTAHFSPMPIVTVKHIKVRQAGRPVSMMMRVEHGMPFAPRDQPAIHRKGGDCGHGEGKCQTAPEQQ